MNLESSGKTLNPAIPNIPANPSWIPADEWSLRRNYRIWEFNRKIFLYPENYIDPTIRSNKTPIFQELEDELLQERITKASAEAAYKRYLSKFAELTQLQFAGCVLPQYPKESRLP